MTAPESAQVGGPNLKATHRNVDALSKVRKNWYVYFRDGAFTFARYGQKICTIGQTGNRLQLQKNDETVPSNHFTGKAAPPLNWRVRPLKESATAQTGLPAARYGAAYFFRCICDMATFGGLFTFNSKM